MKFRIVGHSDAPGQPGEVLLVRDGWNDWFVWITQFYATVIDQNGQRTDLGSVKIARESMSENEAMSSNLLPPNFPELEPTWFSLGQSENYYETLNQMGAEFRTDYLKALKDCAYDLAILAKYQHEEVMQRSLLRDISQDRVRERFHRLAVGDPALTAFAFKYTFPPTDPPGVQPVMMQFVVSPNSEPPSNIHVLIGRNGVGKTRCFDLITRSFLGTTTADGHSPGTLAALLPNVESEGPNDHGFAGLITVSFSAFDEIGLIPRQTSDSKFRYAYIGLTKDRSIDQLEGPRTIKGRLELTDDFVRSVRACRHGARHSRWVSRFSPIGTDCVT